MEGSQAIVGGVHALLPGLSSLLLRKCSGATGSPPCLHQWGNPLKVMEKTRPYNLRSLLQDIDNL